jgi:hypothetical protein
MCCRWLACEGNIQWCFVSVFEYPIAHEYRKYVWNRIRLLSIDDVTAYVTDWWCKLVPKPDGVYITASEYKYVRNLILPDDDRHLTNENKRLNNLEALLHEKYKT